MVVQHNISAMTANRYYQTNNKGLASSLEKLASGYAINKAGDNAAGLAVSEKMRAQIGGLTQASKNAEDGISMVQTYEGALQETDSILQRMRTLAVQSANGSYQDEVDRDAIQLEFSQLNDELNQIADTDYNGIVALNGGVMADGTAINDASKKSRSPSIEQVNASADPKFVYQTAGGSVGNLNSNGDGKVNLDGMSATIRGGVAKSADGTAPYKTSDETTASTLTSALTMSDGTWSGTITTVTKHAVSTELNSTTTDAEKSTQMVVELKDGTTAKVTVGYTAGANNAGVTAAGSVTYAEDTTLADGTVAHAGDTVDGAAAELNTLSDGSTKALTLNITKNYTVDKNYVKNEADKVIGRIDAEAIVSESNAYKHGNRNLIYADHMTLQVGSRSKDAVNFTFAYSSNGLGDLYADMDASARGLGTDQLDLTNQEAANLAIDKIDNAINKVSMIRGTFGAIQNRLEHKISNLDTNTENMTAAESRIRDTQMDKEMMKFTSSQILSQASQSMLAQANSLPQGVLQLLG